MRPLAVRRQRAIIAVGGRRHCKDRARARDNSKGREARINSKERKRGWGNLKRINKVPFQPTKVLSELIKCSAKCLEGQIPVFPLVDRSRLHCSKSQNCELVRTAVMARPRPCLVSSETCLHLVVGGGICLHLGGETCLHLYLTSRQEVRGTRPDLT